LKNQSKFIGAAFERSLIKSLGRTPLLVLGLLLLGGCASNAQIEPAIVEANPPGEIQTPIEAGKPKPADYPVAPFQEDSLYQLLVAEVAGYRQDYETALKKYMEMAEQTRDAGVAARATRLANYLKRHALTLKAAQIWAEVEPDNIDAHRHTADQLMRSGDLEGAVHHMEAIMNLGGLANFDVFAYRAANLDAASRDSLLAAMTGLSARHPDNTQLKFARAVLLEQKGEFEAALALADEMLEADSVTNVIILKVNALKGLHRSEDAISFLKDIIGESSGNTRRLRLMYARFLFEGQRLDDARIEYEIVLKETPRDGDVLFALALVAMEQKRDAEAKDYFQQMIRWNRRVGEAHFYLGSIAEKNKQTPEALKAYQQVSQGYEFLPAQARIARLMLEQGSLEEMQHYFSNVRARKPQLANQMVMIEVQALSQRALKSAVFSLLDSYIDSHPENIEMLYFRGMTGQRFDRVDILERDLREVIRLDPNNSEALNALGYTLTDQLDRHEEALDLISRAIKIKPNEPAYIDSMGWVQFRLNNLDEAILHLRRALALFTNDEVAAHLGEALWSAGEKIEANKIWLKALDLAPDSKILKEVIERLTGH
jgi:tetratricopeptide (TPR) repeat protein